MENNLLQIQLTWENIEIETKASKPCKGPKKEPFQILKGVTGTVKPGEFLAIIGASGSGKTTLLSYLSGKNFAKNLSAKGEVTLNGKPRDEVDYTKFTAFVQQDDVLMETLTVKECLLFAANLKCPGNNIQKMEKVNMLIRELGLQNCESHRIGSPLQRGVSGGERKRTSIGVELITNPALLFLDEPTTGLDSFTATLIVDILQRLSQTKGMTILTTIHQPNSEIYGKFGNLMLLSAGKVIYFNKANLALDYFTGHGFGCWENVNPAEHFMNIMSAETFENNMDKSDSLSEDDEGNPEIIKAYYQKRIVQLVTNYEMSELKCYPHLQNEGLSELSGDNISRLKYTASWGKQTLILAKRGIVNTLRTKSSSAGRLVITIVLALFVLAIYWDIPDSGDEAMKDRQGLMFVAVTCMVMNAFQNVILSFPEERAVLMRDQASSLYNISAYFVGKVSSELPFHLLYPIVFCIIMYHGCGLNTEENSKFPIFTLVMLLCYLSSMSYTIFIGAIIPERDIVVAIVPIMIVPLMLLSGFLVSLDNITYALYPFQYIANLNYGWSALIANEFEDNHLYINGQERTDYMIDLIDLEFEIWECIVALISLYVGFLILAFIILKYNS